MIQLARRHTGMGVLATLLLTSLGCSSVSGPVTIKHERTSSLSDLAQSDQRRKEPVDERTAAAIADLRREKEQSDQRAAALLDLLKSKNMISDEEAALVTGPTTSGAEGEQGAPEEKKSLDDIKEEIRSDVTNELLRQIWTINNAMKEKDKRLRFGGDIRLRYEKDRFDKNNADFAQPANPTQIMNTKTDSDRFKFRVRVGAEALVNDEVNAVIRLSTGSTSNPVSTNATMGDFMNKDSVLFDLAYLKWQPWKSLTLYGGRMPNPFFSTDLVWDTDVSFEGLALQAKTPNTESWTPFLTTGAFPLQQNDFTEHGKWLLGGQIGAEKKNKKGISTKIGAAYYDFKNITGVRNDPLNPKPTDDFSLPLFQQKGNTLFNISADPNVTKLALASEFKELNFTGALDIGFWDPVHIVLLGDYVKNLGFNQDKVNALVGDVDDVTEGFQPTPKQVEGYQLGMSLGYLTVQDAGQWRAYLYKKRLEADAVVDAFTDSDFHLGGTNAKGWILGGDIGLAKNYWLTLKWLSADEISGPPLAIDVFQADINARF